MFINKSLVLDTPINIYGVGPMCDSHKHRKSRFSCISHLIFYFILLFLPSLLPLRVRRPCYIRLRVARCRPIVWANEQVHYLLNVIYVMRWRVYANMIQSHPNRLTMHFKERKTVLLGKRISIALVLNLPFLYFFLIFLSIFSVPFATLHFCDADKTAQFTKCSF